MKNRVRKSRSIGIIFLSQGLPIGSEPDKRVTVFGQRAPIDTARVESGLEARRAFDRVSQSKSGLTSAPDTAAQDRTSNMVRRAIAAKPWSQPILVPLQTKK